MATPNGVAATASRQAATPWSDLHHFLGHQPREPDRPADAPRLHAALQRFEALVGIKDQVDAAIRGSRPAADGAPVPRSDNLVRRKIRDLYFGIEDVAVRRESADTI